MRDERLARVFRAQPGRVPYRRVNRLGRSDALRFRHLQAIYDNLNHINML